MLSVDLAPYHLALVARSAAAGAVVAVVLAVLGRRVAGPGRLAVVGVGVATMLTLERLIDRPTTVVIGILSVIVAPTFRTIEPDVVPWLGLVSLCGVFVAVPDTEPALVALMVLAVPVVTGRLRATGRGDRLVVTALVLVTAWVGSAGRSELMGGLACVGLLTGPVQGVARRSTRHAVALVAVHVVLVLIASRVVTRWTWADAMVGLVLILAVPWLASIVGFLADPANEAPSDG